MMATIHPIRQDDAKSRPKQNDNRQRNHSRVQRLTGDKNKRYFYMGFRRRSNNRNDEHGERQRHEQNIYKPVIFIIPTPIHPGKKQVSQSGRFFQNNTRTQRKSQRSLVQNTTDRETVNSPTLHQPSSFHRSFYY